MLDIHVSHELETALITYPKSGSSSLRTIFKKEEQDYIKTEWQYRQAQVPNFIKQVKELVPLHYNIKAFVRDPVDRWVSSFAFIAHTEYNLFFSDISDVQKNVSEAPDEWYLTWVGQILKLNNYHCTLNDMHFCRMLYPLLLLQLLYPNLEMVPLNRMNRSLAEMFDCDRDIFDNDRKNSAEKGYASGFDYTVNQEHIYPIQKKLHLVLDQALQLPWNHKLNMNHRDNWKNAVRGHLHLEKLIYKNVRSKELPPAELFEWIFRNEKIYATQEMFTEYKYPQLDVYRILTYELLQDHLYPIRDFEHIRNILISNQSKFNT